MNKNKEDKFDKKLRLVFVLILMISFAMVGVVGGMMNLTAVSMNGGRMPVDSSKLGYELSSDTHFTYENIDEVNRHYLTDKFRIGKIIYSYGDFVIIFSFILVLLCLIDYFYILFKY